MVSPPEHNGDRTVLRTARRRNDVSDVQEPTHASPVPSALARRWQPPGCRPGTGRNRHLPPRRRLPPAAIPKPAIISALSVTAPTTRSAGRGQCADRTYEVLLKTKASVEQFSQVRLSYSEDGDAGSARLAPSPPMAAACRLRRRATQRLGGDVCRPQGAGDRVPEPGPGHAPRTTRCAAPRLRRTSRAISACGRPSTSSPIRGRRGHPECAGQPADVRRQPRRAGSDQPTVKNGQAQWRWRYQRREAMPAQNWSAAGWEFGPNIMASTYRDWSQMGRALPVKAGPRRGAGAAGAG